MKDDESAHSSKKETLSDWTLFGRGGYKFYALAGILLLAFWSMFTGTVTLRWSAGNLNSLSDLFDFPLSDDLDILIFVITLRWSAGNLSSLSDLFDIPLSDDLDILEMEEREKLVKHMWDVYTNSPRIRLPKFWQEAFEAAYEELSNDVAEIREAAISEISKMSLRFVHIELPPLRSLGVRELGQKQTENRHRTATGSNL